VSNYLQRLAANTIRPGGDFHPILNPVFSAPKQQQPVDVPLLEENLVATDAPGPGAGERPETASTSIASQVPLSVPMAAESADDRAKPPESRPPGLNPRLDLVTPQPLAPRSTKSARQPPETEITGQPALRAATPPGETDSHLEFGKPNHQAEEVRPTARPEGPYTPLVSAEHEHEPATVMPHLKRFGFPPEPRNAGPAKSPVLPAREPDEIQIHIGRIEVTAVPPAS